MAAEDILVEVRDLRVWFPVKKGVFARTVDYVKAVDGISFDVRRGEVLGIVGESGCGKSTTARVLMGLVPRRFCKYSRLWFDAGTSGRPGTRMSGRRASSLAMVFQDPLGALNPRQTVRAMLDEAIAHAGGGGTASSLLADVGLDDGALDRYPHEFSGGQRQRLCIARALAARPELLICDEAVSALDLSVRSQVLDLLSGLRRKLSLSMIFITHDLGVVRCIADRVLVMNRGRIVEEGTCREVLSNPREDYTRRLLAAVPRIPS